MTEARGGGVAAVVVSHDGARWLPDLLAALRAQTHRPVVAVAVDTGSTDGSAGLLQAGVTDGVLQAVCSLPAATGFGRAVAAGVAEAVRRADVDWVWILHDDCEPEPDALAALLAAGRADPRVGVVGPKVRALATRPLLLEVGVTLARSGRRETLLDRREYDQGQHDGTRDVLAVGSAGMLVRRDVWDELGGFDPALPMLREDVDLGWRARLAGHRVVCHTDAVLHHAEAAARGSRSGLTGPAGRHRLHRLDRRGGAYVLLANLPLLLVPVAAVSLAGAGLLRAVGYLVGKRPRHAVDELAVLASVLGRPDRLVRARIARRRSRRVPARTALPLLAPRSAGRRALGETASAVLGTRAGAELAGRHRGPDRRGRAAPAPETGPTDETQEDLPAFGSGALRRLLLRPALGVLAGLAVLTLVAARALVGDGRLMGGALLPAPDDGLDLWRTYVAAWHPVGVGSDTLAPPWLAVVAALATVLGGAERAVTLILLGGVPLAGFTAYLAARRAVVSPAIRVWAALAWALLPATLGAVAAGRLGTAVAAVLLPPTGLAVSRALGLDGHDRRAGNDRALWAAVLLLAVLISFVPLTAVVAAALALPAAVRVRGANLARLAALVVAPPVLLLPWWPAVAADPGWLLREAGLAGPGLAEADLPPVAAVLAYPGGPGLPPLLLTAGLVLAALGALLRPDRRRAVLTGWLLAVAGLVAAVALSRADVSTPTLPAAVPAWPGPATLLVGAGLLLAAAVGGGNVRQRVRASSFGWRQPAIVLVAAAAALGPLLAAGWWAVRGADGPLERRDPVLLPAFVAAEGAQPARPRTLALRVRADGSLGFTVLRSAGPRLGDAELSPPGDGGTGLTAVVADLASGRGGDAAARLVPHGIRFVLLARPPDPAAGRAVARAVDAVPGVVRVSGPAGTVLWRVDYPTGRLRVVPAGAPVSGPDGAPPPARVLPAGQVHAATAVPPGDGERLLVLADPADSGWRARLDGRALRPRTYDGWAQAFVLPASASPGGQLRLDHDGGVRPTLLWLQLGAVLVVVVLALPAAGTRDERWADR